MVGNLNNPRKMQMKNPVTPDVRTPHHRGEASMVADALTWWRLALADVLA